MTRHALIRYWLILAFLALPFLAGCDKGEGKQEESPERRGLANYLLKSPPSSFDVPIGVNIDNRVRVLGMDYAPSPLVRGQTFTITFYFESLQDTPGDYLFYGHLEPTNGEPFRIKVDHPILNGRFPMQKWKKGDIIKDLFTGRMPNDFPDDTARLHAGFYKDAYRLPAYGPDKARMDSLGRIVFGDLPLEELPGLKVKSTVLQTETPLVIDGSLDEPAWQYAQVLGPFVLPDGKRAASPRTVARMLYDNAYLYIAIECDDPDMVASSRERDGDLSRDDRVGFFVDTAFDVEYNVVMANPLGAVTDLRYHPVVHLQDTTLDPKWDSELIHAVKVRGTVNNPQDGDVGWTVEIAIPHLIPPTDQEARVVFNANFFRYDRNHKGEEQLTVWVPTFYDDPYYTKTLGQLNLDPTLAAEPKPPVPEGESEPVSE